MRRSVELFNRCLEACEEANESRIAVVDFLDPVMVILSDTIEFLYACAEGQLPLKFTLVIGTQTDTCSKIRM